ncbi:hypothetical protein FQN57_006139 [Myotisia sp. PD_48]|nr:hypothetical protein FQN57_006139 [Myotisia sp. PD_48]
MEVGIGSSTEKFIHAVHKRYGLSQRVLKSQFLDGPPLTEEDNEHNDDQKRQPEIVKKLQNYLDDKIFIADSMNLMASKLTGKPGRNHARPEVLYRETDEGIPKHSRIRSIRLNDAQLTYHTNLKTLQMLVEAVMDLPLPNTEQDFPEADTPEVLYRAFNASCHTRYDERLGFRSSSAYLISPEYDAQTLEFSSLVDKESLRNHCDPGSNKRPSDLIALSDSPSRIFNFVPPKDKSNYRIAVINVRKLLSARVLFNRTRTVARSLNLKPCIKDGRVQPNEGIEYISPNYWVAYRWIPAECIECSTTIGLLKQACKERGIGMMLP